MTTSGDSPLRGHRRVRDLLLGALVCVAFGLILFLGGYLKLTGEENRATTAGVVAAGVVLILLAMTAWFWWKDDDGQAEEPND